MKVILNQDVPNLGEEGDVREVSGGYARNYLIPRNLVLLFNTRNAALIENRRASIEARKEEKRREAMSVKERVEGEPLVIRMPAGANGKLFGSVTSQTIAEELEKKGIRVERRRIEVPDKTLKTVGTHGCAVRLYDDERAELSVKIEATESKKSEAKSEGRASTKKKSRDTHTTAEPSSKTEQNEALAEESAPPKSADEAADVVSDVAKKAEQVSEILDESVQAAEDEDARE
jgi:large subunit ribosomal protein L9